MKTISAKQFNKQYGAELATSTMPQTNTQGGNFLTSTGASFKASEGGDQVVNNIANTFGNIPSSSRDLVKGIVSPVNPFDTASPINIGSNTVKSAKEVSSIFSNRGFANGIKDILGGFADTYLKVGQAIYGGLDKAYNALADNPTKAISDVTKSIAKKGIEDPMFIPSLLYGGGEVGKTDAISALASPVTRGVDTSLSGLATKATKSATESVDKTLGSVMNKAGNAVETISGIVTPIESATETALNPTRLIPKEKLANIPIENIKAPAVDRLTKLNDYVKQAEKAVNDYSQPTPLQIAGNKAQDALEVISNKLSKQGQLKQEALGIVGDRPITNLPTLRASLKDELRNRLGINIDTQTGEIIPATGRVSKIALDSADNKMVKDVTDLFSSLGEKPTVRQVDDAIDAVQDILYKRKLNVAVPVNGQVESVLKQFTGKLNNSVKKIAGESYRKANDKFSYMVDIRDTLNKALGSEGVRGASLMKQLFSPSGEAPRRLFADIKKLTGVDLVQEATLAKFVMENVGDARQASLLEEAIKGNIVSPKSFIQTAAQNQIKKLQNPIGKARNIIKNSYKE